MCVDGSTSPTEHTSNHTTRGIRRCARRLCGYVFQPHVPLQPLLSFRDLIIVDPIGRVLPLRFHCVEDPLVLTEFHHPDVLTAVSPQRGRFLFMLNTMVVGRRPRQKTLLVKERISADAPYYSTLAAAEQHAHELAEADNADEGVAMEVMSPHSGKFFCCADLIAWGSITMLAEHYYSPHGARRRQAPCQLTVVIEQNQVVLRLWARRTLQVDQPVAISYGGSAIVRLTKRLAHIHG
jgi:hypothetical protein